MTSNYAMIFRMSKKQQNAFLVTVSVAMFITSEMSFVFPDAVADPAPALSGEALAREALAAHNRVRGKVGVPELSWDSDLAKLAQQWAHHLCRGGKQLPMLQHRKIHQGSPGENLWEGATSEAQAYSITEAVQRWEEEQKYFDKKTGECRGGVCGHYTQLVWRGTTHVGCGVATCSASGMTATVWACNYSPAGNIIGERPY
jgi:pathogenesis-related protein 1